MNISYVQKCEARNTTRELSNKNQTPSHHDHDCTAQISSEYYRKYILECVGGFIMCFNKIFQDG